MKTLITILAMMLQVSSMASESVVVKTISKSLKGELTLKGSGVVIKESNRTFILTSDHVVIHEACLASYNIVDDKGATYSANLMRVDMLSGLALLEVKSANDLKNITLNDFAQNNIKRASTEVQTIGFPIDSEGLVTDAQAKILSATSTRFNYANAQTLIEVEAHGEKGMSGGALMSSSGEFLGTLSHKYLQDNHIMAIPANVSKTWITETIKDEELYKKPKNFRPLEAQMQNKDLIQMDGIRIESVQLKQLKIKNVEDLKGLMPKNKNKTKIVNSGTDPIGIGGQEDETDNGIILSYGSRSDQFIIGTYSRDNKKITAIRSTEHYMSLLGHKEIPVKVTFNSFETLQGTIGQINKLGLNLKNDITALDTEIPNLPKKFQGPMHILMQKISQIASLAASDLAVVIDHEELSQIVALPIWNDFSDTDVFFATTNILSNLEKLNTKLQNITN